MDVSWCSSCFWLLRRYRPRVSWAGGRRGPRVVVSRHQRRKARAFDGRQARDDGRTTGIGCRRKAAGRGCPCLPRPSLLPLFFVEEAFQHELLKALCHELVAVDRRDGPRWGSRRRGRQRSGLDVDRPAAPPRANLHQRRQLTEPPQSSPAFSAHDSCRRPVWEPYGIG